MAKQAAGINKSEKIREYYASHRRVKPKQVIAALAEDGIEVNAALVSTVRAAMKKRKKKRGIGQVAATKVGSDRFELATLMQAKKLADQLGGVAKAKEALDALARLQ